MVNLSLMIIIIAQLFQDLPSPTPWASPTPVSTEISVFLDDAEEIVATAQSEQYTFEAEGDQVYFDNQPILPNIESSNFVLLFSYFKWTVSSGSQAVFGPFAPLMIPMGVLILFAFISLFVYFWENVIVTAFKIAGFVINSILRLFGR